MKGRIWLLLAAVLSALIVASVLFESESPVPTANPIAEFETPTPIGSAPTSAADGVDVPLQSGPEASIAMVDDAKENGAAFRVDAAGDLVLDEQTRLNIEALIASTEPRNLYAETREHTEGLPPAAARLAEELVDKFVHYQQAQRQTYPPDVAPLTPEDAVRELEGLHALREAHFGPEVARRFYGNEEIIAREMIEVMRLENDQSLTPEEKLERAQALRERLPGVAAIERRNRESVATQKPQEE
jgi:hypothetical protein